MKIYKPIFRYANSTWSLSDLNKFQDINSLTKRQQLIRQKAIQFSYNNIKPFAAQWDQKQYLPILDLKKTVEYGYTSMFIQGQHNVSTLEASLIFQALSHSSIPFTSFLAIHNLCVSMLDKYLNPTLKQKYLKDLIKLDKIISFCLTQPQNGSDSRNLRTIATKNDQFSYKINGTKSFITNAQYADFFIVVAKTSETDVSMFLVQKTFQGIQISQNQKKMGWKSNSTNQVTFKNCIVPNTHIIGKLGQGFKIAMQGLDRGRLNISSCSLGVAAAALSKSINYSKSRQQFGKKIKNFQSIEFNLADMNTSLQTSRLLVRNAAKMIDQKNPERSMYVAMAKKFSTECATNIVDKAIQIHGGYGYLSKYDLQRYYRDIRVHEIIQGTNEIMRMIIGKRLLKQ